MIQRANLGGQIATIAPYRPLCKLARFVPTLGPRSPPIYWCLAGVFPNIYSYDLLTIRTGWVDPERI